MKKQNYNKEDIPKFNNIGEKLDEIVERIKDIFSESKILFVKDILKGGNKKDVISSFLKETVGEKTTKKKTNTEASTYLPRKKMTEHSNFYTQV